MSGLSLGEGHSVGGESLENELSNILNSTRALKRADHRPEGPLAMSPTIHGRVWKSSTNNPGLDDLLLMYVCNQHPPGGKPPG
jgi:hypothetical protein